MFVIAGNPRAHKPRVLLRRGLKKKNALYGDKKRRCVHFSTQEGSVAAVLASPLLPLAQSSHLKHRRGRCQLFFSFFSIMPILSSFPGSCPNRVEKRAGSPGPSMAPATRRQRSRPA